MGAGRSFWRLSIFGGGSLVGLCAVCLLWLCFSRLQDCESKSKLELEAVRLEVARTVEGELAKKALRRGAADTSAQSADGASAQSRALEAAKLEVIRLQRELGKTLASLELERAASRASAKEAKLLLQQQQQPQRQQQRQQQRPQQQQQLQQKRELLLVEAPAAESLAGALLPGSYSAVGIAAVADPNYQKRFAVSIASQKCYAERHGYEHAVIDPANYPSCKHFNDFFFRKHCSVARFLESRPPDYILFVMDGDNPVVVLDRSLDHWLEEAKATDVILYERWMNNEIMAGNYAVRNSAWGIAFCDGWASYNYELPKAGYYSSDNGAIHLHLLRALQLSKWEPCSTLWHHLGSDRAEGLDEYFSFVTCSRLLMGAPRRWKVKGKYRVTILPRGHSWSIDGGNVDSKTSSVGPISHHGQKTEQNYLQYFTEEFVKSADASCANMMKEGFQVDPATLGGIMSRSLDARLDGGFLSWTRQFPPPWDWVYKGCMKSLSCRPLEDEESLVPTMLRPPQAKLPWMRVPNNAKFKECAKDHETCACVGLAKFGHLASKRFSVVVRVERNPGKIACGMSAFGEDDPASGESKRCYCAEGL
ncbi:unnamed protein product [Polarella glacialis]|uniref:Rhodanese domain-containing protein n=1 Tax=Polarella glacialis TaxID=89957 RepID=A0A813EUJ9_POLGL|nr:unnamed protein product [Polarella glacialis]